MRKLTGLVLFISILIAAVFLPWSELISWVEFKIVPARAKRSHFVRLLGPRDASRVYLLGTVHDGHFQSGSPYPYRELRSVIEKLKPSLVLVEIRPGPMSQGQWGEGPPEMPYVVAIAREEGIAVAGMDFWKPGYTPMKDFKDREDQMAKSILEVIQGQPTVLVLTGYSHVSGLGRRLAGSGLHFDSGFSDQEKDELFAEPVSDAIPAGYFEAVASAADRASQHQSDYPAEWGSKRLDLLKRLESKRRDH